jgi:hypothetical protein
VMVARWDLWAEVPIETIPSHQLNIVGKVKRKWKKLWWIIVFLLEQKLQMFFMRFCNELIIWCYPEKLQLVNIR